VDGKARMQRAIGILKDHLQLAEEVPTGAPGQGGAGDGHPSLPFPLQRAEYPQHRRLAAAGFPYQPEAFAFAHVKADILDSVHGVGALAEMDVEPFNLDHSGTSTPKRYAGPPRQAGSRCSVASCSRGWSRRGREASRTRL